MFFRKIFKRNFFVRKFVFLTDINFIELTMRFCRNSFRSKIFYRIDENFEKCVAYMSFNYMCNLFIFFTIIRRIYNKKKVFVKKFEKFAFCCTNESSFCNNRRQSFSVWNVNSKFWKIKKKIDHNKMTKHSRFENE